LKQQLIAMQSEALSNALVKITDLKAKLAAKPSSAPHARKAGASGAPRSL
jgi:hypothetical protein